MFTLHLNKINITSQVTSGIPPVSELLYVLLHKIGFLTFVWNPMRAIFSYILENLI